MIILHLMMVAAICKTAVTKVIDCKCVYEEKKTIKEDPFDPTTQICCQKSGVLARFQKGQEMDCCGEIDKEIRRNRTHICCKKSGVHQRYDGNREIGCCGETIYKLDTEPCLDKQDAKKTTCKNNSEISEPRNDTTCTKMPKSRVYSLQHQQCRNEVVQLLTERFGKKDKKIKRAITRLGKALQGKSKQRKPFMIIYL